MMKSICVFCGSNPGAQPVYAAAARELGTLIAGRGMTLVYGGGNVGLMGIIADAALAAGGRVVGVIPDFLLRKEVGHTGLTRMEVVETMHERKQKMADLSDGFIALPGGMGTLEEMAEILTWGQLGLHGKPFGLMNTATYYQPLSQMFDQMVTEQFLHPGNRGMVLTSSEPADLLDQMAAYEAPDVEKWLNRSRT